MGLGIAKGYLMADESDNVRGRALQEQDLAFQRKLPFVQRSYLLGVKKMLLLISYYLGANLDTLNIDVKIKMPHRLSAEMLEQYRTTIEYIAEVKNLMTEINPEHQLSLEDLNLLVYKAGLDTEIVNIPGLISIPKDNLGDSGIESSTNSTRGGASNPEIDSSDFEVEGDTVEFGESQKKSSLIKQKKSVTKLSKVLAEHLNQPWSDKVTLNHSNILMEDKNSSRYTVNLDGIPVPSKLYECFLKVGWLGSRINLHEPEVFFEKLHQARKSMYLIEQDKQ